MITEREIDEALEEWMSSTASYTACERIAQLLIIKELYYNKARRSEKAIDFESSRKTEFLEALKDTDSVTAFAVLDELMTDVLQIINPKLYRAVIDRLKENKRTS